MSRIKIDKTNIRMSLKGRSAHWRKQNCRYTCKLQFQCGF